MAAVSNGVVSMDGGAALGVLALNVCLWRADGDPKGVSLGVWRSDVLRAESGLPAEGDRCSTVSEITEASGVASAGECTSKGDETPGTWVENGPAAV